MIKTYGGRKLRRTSSHRKAMLSNMATSLLLHERVQTTAAKAKELKPLAERLISRARKGDHRWVRQVIQSKKVFAKLFDVLAPRYQGREGGYVQLFHLDRRAGDNAEKMLVKLV